MILFYKQEADRFAAERLVLETSYPNEILFAENVSGKEEVIVVDSIENVIEAVHAKPTARIVLLTEDKYSLHPDEILELGKKGVSKFANRGDVNDLTERISEAYSEKKSLNFYIRQESPVVSKITDHRIEMDGLRNEHIIGKSAEVVRLLQVIRTFSKFDEDILVRGENGVGKEVFVKTLLDNLPKAKVALGVLNTAEVSSHLLASELFGYKKGAFTGADRDKDGMLATYSKGVLYFDEIGELPLESQAMLLRVLQNREFRPVGSTLTKVFEGQIVMATNRPLEKMVSDGLFRADLYNRMKKMVVYIPPLRSRKEDIPILVDAFLSRLNIKYPSFSRGISDEAVSLLKQLDWPGNVRELENFIFRAYQAEPGSNITLESVKMIISNDESPQLGSALPNIDMLNSIARKFDVDLTKSVGPNSANLLTKESQQLSM